MTVLQEDTIARVITHLVITRVLIMCVVNLITIVEVVFVVSILAMESCVVLTMLTALNAVGTVIVTAGAAEVSVTMVNVITINALGDGEHSVMILWARGREEMSLIETWGGCLDTDG